jgi:NADP-dependent 3-hydroxy acid dehydrogenase YdfG
MSKKNVRDKVAIITGASSGIGKATAIRLAQSGASIVLAARRKDALEAIAQEIKEMGANTLVVPTDVTDQGQAEALVAKTIYHWKKVDIFIANAGEYVRGPVTSLTKADFEHSFAVNFYGTLYGILSVLPHMLERRSGHIVVVSSLDAKKGLPLDGPYAAAKFAITGFAEVMRQELHGTGVHVTTILPGRIDTPMIENLKVPWISRKVSPEIVARAIIRGIERRKAEVIVPFLQAPYGYLNALFPRFMDWIVRAFHLQGWEIEDN